MNATKYTPAKVREWLKAREALEAVPQGQDYLAEAKRLSAAEQSLLDEGWKNLESLDEMKAFALYDKDAVVAELSKLFPDADPGPAGLWGFVNAGWEGDVDESGLDDWAAAWEDACNDPSDDVSA